MSAAPARLDHEAPDGTVAGAAGDFVLAESLGYLVNRLARAMARELAAELQPHGVAIGQWAVLLILWARDGLSQAELSRRVAIEPPTMVRTIDRMIRDGLVTQVRDPRDARAVRIQLTDRGRALRDELIPLAAEVNARALGDLEAGERATLLRLIRTVLASLDHDRRR